MASFQRFSSDRLKLSEKEGKVLTYLEKAIEIMAGLYDRQKNSRYPGANFYPHDASREEIEEAAKKDEALLDPYTIVERNGAGKLLAVPYREKFAKELKEIGDNLKEAAQRSDDEDFKDYLTARADDLLKDNLDKSNELWLKAGGSRIGCVIGPFDRFHDKLFFVKRAYTAYIGVLDKDQTEKMERLRKTILTSERKHLPGAKQAKISQMRLRVENTVAAGGIEADFLFAADNLPASADIEFLKTNGTISTVFLPVVDSRFSRWIFPIFQSLFSEELKNEYSKEELRQAFLQITSFCEVSHSLMRYDDAAGRLKEIFPYFDNMYSDILAIKTAEILFLKGVLTEHQLKAVLIAEICQGSYYLEGIKTGSRPDSFGTGYAIFLEFLLDAKALQKSDSKFSIDFQRVFLAIDEVAHVFEYYLSVGSREDGKELLSQFQLDAILAEFTPMLETLRGDEVIAVNAKQ